MRELHLEERPVTFKQVVGQREACQQLVALGKSESGIPHCLMFTGPSGCGKTTLARIVRAKLKCGDPDFTEINAANNRGVDMVRDIQRRIGSVPIAGACRVWLIDECHMLTAEAQGAFLKLLEEPPDHVYFMLATTNPEKLRKAIRTRCTEIKVRELTEGEVMGLVNRVAEEHTGEILTDKVAGRLAEVAEGSARKALVLLQQIMGIDDEGQQINILQNVDAKQAAFTIAQALMKRAKWGTIAGILRNCDEDPESIRWMILSYFSKVALGGRDAARAVDIIEEFEDTFFNSKKAGLIRACYRACAG